MYITLLSSLYTQYRNYLYGSTATQLGLTRKQCVRVHVCLYVRAVLLFRCEFGGQTSSFRPGRRFHGNSEQRRWLFTKWHNHDGVSRRCLVVSSSCCPGVTGPLPPLTQRNKQRVHE